MGTKGVSEGTFAIDLDANGIVRVVLAGMWSMETIARYSIAISPGTPAMPAGAWVGRGNHRRLRHAQSVSGRLRGCGRLGRVPARRPGHSYRGERTGEDRDPGHIERQEAEGPFPKGAHATCSTRSRTRKPGFTPDLGNQSFPRLTLAPSHMDIATL